MKTKKSKTPYRTISLPNDLYEEVFEYVQKNTVYASITHFIKIAIREKFDRIKEI